MQKLRSVIASLLVLACAAPKPASVTQPPAAAGSSRELQTWANGAVFYEVFVRSFQDSDGDGKGDLKGLISRLDYLRDLGVDALWLMPVFASPSYHGYDTADYETINPDYGTNADFARLLEEAHRRGLRVVVDLVLNHTSSQHPWFVESASSSASARREWYVWRPDDPGWGQPWNPSGKTWHFKNGAYYYGLFWAGMPDLNFRTDAVRAEGKRIGALWLSRGVDGFRLDAVRHLIETGPGEHGQNDTEESHAYWKEFAAAMRAAKPDAALIGEAWTETPIIARYYGDTSRVPGGDELPLNFDFPLAGRIIAGVRSGDARPIAAKLKEIRETYPEGATDVPFLTNHDQARVASELAGDFAKLRSAAAVLLTLPGTPFLYYGEEVGLANGPGDGDEPKRTPMPWDDSAGGGFTTGTPWYRFSKGRETANVASQTRKPDSLLSAYRALLRARHASPALARGSLEVLQENGPVLAFLRTLGDERVLVAHNLSPEPQRVSLAVRATRLEPLYGDPGVEVRPGDAVRCALLPHASALLRVR